MSIRKINKELAKLGDIELVKAFGRQYFYFAGADVDLSKEQGVHGGITKIADLSLEEWLEEGKARLAEKE